MSLKDRLTAPVTDRRVRCGVADWMVTLSDEDRGALEVAFTSRAARTVDLFDACREYGLALQYNALLKHRNGACSCP